MLKPDLATNKRTPSTLSLRGSIMFSRCANPDCGVSFDYRQGQLFRFHKAYAPHEPPPNTHSVQHFWLCGACSCQYTLEYREDRGVLMTRRLEKAWPEDWNRVIAAA